MPKSKLYFSLSADDAASLNGDGAVDAAPIRKKSGSGSGSEEEHMATVAAAGRLPEEVYANMLPGWRAALRRRCVAVVEWESEVIGKWQVRTFCTFFFLSWLPCHSGRRRAMGGRAGGWMDRKLMLSLAGACTDALARRVFFANVDAWHAHVLPRVPPRIFLLWLRWAGKRVREPGSNLSSCCG
jgi:hypothetical protein